MASASAATAPTLMPTALPIEEPVFFMDVNFPLWPNGLDKNASAIVRPAIDSPGYESLGKSNAHSLEFDWKPST